MKAISDKCRFLFLHHLGIGRIAIGRAVAGRNVVDLESIDREVRVLTCTSRTRQSTWWDWQDHFDQAGNLLSEISKMKKKNWPRSLHDPGHDPGRRLRSGGSLGPCRTCSQCRSSSNCCLTLQKAGNLSAASCRAFGKRRRDLPWCPRQPLRRCCC